MSRVLACLAGVFLVPFTVSAQQVGAVSTQNGGQTVIFGVTGGIVDVQTPNGQPPRGQRTTHTDTDGRYEFHELPPGNYITPSM